jgi:hypothetical protein
MSYQFKVICNGIKIRTGERERITITVFELDRDAAKRAAIHEAGKYFFRNVTVDKIVHEGIGNFIQFPSDRIRARRHFRPTTA